MSELVNKLATAADAHKGADLGGLLQWAMLHIQEQDEALAEAREELDTEQSERIRLERVLHSAKAGIEGVASGILMGLPTNIQLARDHAPHINIMAHHGIAPYAKKPRKTRPANHTPAVSSITQEQ
jgi:hypothetical protein